jgi:hypothetical protein
MLEIRIQEASSCKNFHPALSPSSLFAQSVGTNMVLCALEGEFLLFSRTLRTSKKLYPLASNSWGRNGDTA